LDELNVINDMKDYYAGKNNCRMQRLFLLTVLLVLLFALCLPFAVPSVADAAPIILSGPLPNATVNSAYSTTLVANTTCTWALTGGVLPPGLTLASNGTIFGVPTMANTYSFMVSATDNTSSTATGLFSISVILPPLTFATSSLPQATEGESYGATISVNNAIGSLSWVLSGGSLPIGLSFDSSNGYIWGTPVGRTAGSHSITITVTDNGAISRSVQQTFSLYVEKGYYRPTITIDPGLAEGSTRVYGNGRLLATLQGGESMQLSVDYGTSATVSVDPVVNHPSKENIRYKTETSSAVVNESTLSVNFSYFTEYHIIMKSSIQQAPVPAGTGWYRSGSTFATTAQETADGGTGTQYRFASWLLSSNNTSTSRNLSFNVSAPETITAQYDTYYLLTVNSPYGEPSGTGWYKSGSEAEWSIKNAEVPMKGILGFFKGKYTAINPTGKEIMTGPKTIAITWDNDYTLPFILIPLTVLVIAGSIFALLWFVIRPRMSAKPAAGQQMALSTPAMMPFQQPQPQTTVVMIKDSRAQGMTTKEQLMEKFGELLEIYEKEIRESLATQSQHNVAQVVHGGQPQFLNKPSTQIDPAVGTTITCTNAAKKLLRTIVTPWKQSELRTEIGEAAGKENSTSAMRLVITWSRSMYNEWQVSVCELPQGHQGVHEGSKKTEYTLLNTITEEKSYGPNEPVAAPSPHFTDGMPEITIDAGWIITPDALPAETMH